MKPFFDFKDKKRFRDFKETNSDSEAGYQESERSMGICIYLKPYRNRIQESGPMTSTRSDELAGGLAGRPGGGTRITQKARAR